MATMTSATFFLLLLLSLGTSTYGLLGIPIGTATPSLPVPTPNPTVPTPTLPVPTPNPTVPTLPTTPSVPYLPNPSVPALPNPIGNPALGVTCPINALKLGVCANVLGGLLNVVLGGGVAKAPCCSLVAGLLDLDAAVCLCTAIKANVLGINLNVPLSLSLLLNDCGKNLPAGFLCL